jgi:hypothetical protein
MPTRQDMRLLQTLRVACWVPGRHQTFILLKSIVRTAHEQALPRERERVAQAGRAGGRRRGHDQRQDRRRGPVLGHQAGRAAGGRIRHDQARLRNSTAQGRVEWKLPKPQWKTKKSAHRGLQQWPGLRNGTRRHRTYVPAAQRLPQPARLQPTPTRLHRL